MKNSTFGLSAKMLLGEYEHKIDDKGRITIPPRFRAHFKNGGVLTQGVEKCVIVYPLSEWEKLSERRASLPPDRIKTRRINRFTFASSFDFELDGQGRISLPLPLRRYAGIKDTVVIAGMNSFLELWNKDNWEAEKVLMNGQVPQMLESLETR